MELDALLRRAEREGTWPLLLCIIHVVFLSKPDGGWRPISLYTALYRLWARLRLPLAKAWEYAPGPRGGMRQFWWGGVGKACDRAMWQHAI
eukprot:4777938-Lingulodinium_polyedra.AAC.1